MSGKVPSTSDWKVSFIRGTWNIDKLMLLGRDSMRSYIRQKETEEDATSPRFHVHRYVGMGSYHRQTPPNDTDRGKVGYSEERRSTIPSNSAECGDVRLLEWLSSDIGKYLEKADKAFDIWPYPQEIMAAVEDLRRWKRSRGWFKERHLPWKIGWLLTGKQGAGKSTLIKAASQALDMPVLLFDLASMNDREFGGFWREALNFAPCTVLFEDLDTVYEGRKYVAGERGGGLDFGCILNHIDGVENADGIFLAVTTNRPEMIDEALGAPAGGGKSTRPGRINRVIEMLEMAEPQRRLLASRLLTDCPHRLEEIVRQGKGMTADQFSNFCAGVALVDFWQRQSGPPMPKLAG